MLVSLDGTKCEGARVRAGVCVCVKIQIFRYEKIIFVSILYEHGLFKRRSV